MAVYLLGQYQLVFMGGLHLSFRATPSRWRWELFRNIANNLLVGFLYIYVSQIFHPWDALVIFTPFTYPYQNGGS